MKQRVKAWMKAWLPPVVLDKARKWTGLSINFRTGYASWAEAQHVSSGYDRPAILQKVLVATQKVKNGEAVFERDSVIFDRVDYSWEVLSGLMWSAARDRGRLSVLDFGGSLGSSYFQNRVFLQGLPEVQWGVVEQPHFVTAGQQHIQTKTLRFYDSAEACIAEIRPNVVLLSSVLQYLESYVPVVEQVASAGARTIIIDRTIVTVREESAIYVQHVPESIYDASYPCRSIPERELVATLARRGYALISDFRSVEFPPLDAIDCIFKGYIFVRE
jgi:putative methyltransferase (TIGR04325 family)